MFIDKDSFLLVDDEPEGEDVTIPYETTPDSIDEEEDATETVIVEDIADNLVDKAQEIIVEEEKEITLRITDYSDSSVVFRKTSPILGMSCEASSEVDNDIKYMWTKNGRFIDTTSSHVTFETNNNGRISYHNQEGKFLKWFLGNLIIYNPEEDDEGVYQCVVSNSEGVVFSRVTKVKMLRPRARALVTEDRLVDSDKVTVYLPVSNNGKFNEDEEAENVFLVMPASASEADQ